MNSYQSDYTQKPRIFELIRNHENEAAKRHLETHPEEINLKGWMDDTPLHIAAWSNNVELIRYLLEQGADVNAKRSGVYKTPLCWVESLEAACLLLEHGATMNDEELEHATRTDKPEIVDLLLQKGAAINLRDPQYLHATSTSCLQIYFNHGIPLNGSNDRGDTLLHQLIWMDLPEVFDFALQHGGPWNNEMTMHNLYYDAKIRGRKEMTRHMESQYAHLISYESTPVDPQNNVFEYVRFIRSIPGEPAAFMALSGKTKLLRYSLRNEELSLERVSSFATPASANFTFDKNGQLLLPTGENKLLVIDPYSLEIIRIETLPENLLLGQLNWLPKRNCFVAAYSWDIVLLDEHFNLLLHVDAEDGTGLPKVNPDENLLAFFSYDQEDYFNLYHLGDALEINFIETFFKDWNNTSCGFAFNGNEFAVSFPQELEYYRFAEGRPVKLWEIAISGYTSTYDISRLACISGNMLVLAKGKALLSIDILQQRIVREETLDLVSEIREIYVDNAKKHLFVSTDSELKFVRLL